jgi:hypothetical protein
MLTGRLFYAFLCLLAVTWPVAAGANSRVALVIGNSEYVNIPRLANPASDARLMAKTLQSLGFTLVGGGAQLDLDKAQFDRAVQDFGDALQGAEVGLFFYAGHGVQVRGSNFLVPIRANPEKEADVDFEMLDANLVLRQMEGAGTRLNLVILDACRNNPFGGRGLRSSSRGLAQMQAPEGTLISFATQPGNVALDGSDGNSPFTKALAKIIRQPGLGIFDAFNEVGLEVKKATGGQQQPWVSSSPIGGAFFFSLPAESDPPSASAQPTIQTEQPRGAIRIVFKSKTSQICTAGEAGEECQKELRTKLTGETGIDLVGAELIFRGISHGDGEQLESWEPQYFANCTPQSRMATVKVPDSEYIFTSQCGFSVRDYVLQLNYSDLLATEMGAIIDKSKLSLTFDFSGNECQMTFEQVPEEGDFLAGDVERGSYEVECDTSGEARAILFVATAP